MKRFVRINDDSFYGFVYGKIASATGMSHKVKYDTVQHFNVLEYFDKSTVPKETSQYYPQIHSKILHYCNIPEFLL